MTGYSFYKLHKDEMKQAEVGTFNLTANEKNHIILWKYPGSDISGSLSSTNYIDKSEYYEDENGDAWSYSRYLGGWVCLSNPYSEDVGIYISPSTDVVETSSETTAESNTDTDPVTYPSDIPHLTAEEGEDNTPQLIITGVLVGSVLIFTAGIILIIFGIKKTKKPVTITKENESTDDNSDGTTP